MLDEILILKIDRAEGKRLWGLDVSKSRRQLGTRLGNFESLWNGAAVNYVQVYTEP